MKLTFELRLWCPQADLYCLRESCHRPLFWVDLETKPSCTCDSQVSLETLLSEIMIPHIPFWSPLPSTSCLYCCCNRLLKFWKQHIHKFKLQSFLKRHSSRTVVACSGAAVAEDCRLSSLYNQNLFSPSSKGFRSDSGPWEDCEGEAVSCLSWLLVVGWPPLALLDLQTYHIDLWFMFTCASLCSGFPF